MGTPRNSYDYATKIKVARRDYRCDVCKGPIRKGEWYESTHGGLGHEHVDICPSQSSIERTKT